MNVVSETVVALRYQVRHGRGGRSSGSGGGRCAGSCPAGGYGELVEDDEHHGRASRLGRGRGQQRQARHGAQGQRGGPRAQLTSRATAELPQRPGAEPRTATRRARCSGPPRSLARGREDEHEGPAIVTAMASPTITQPTITAPWARSLCWGLPRSTFALPASSRRSRSPRIRWRRWRTDRRKAPAGRWR